MDQDDPFGFYRLLGLTPFASMEEIKAAGYRRPYYIPSGDESDKAFAEAFRRTPEAYAVLSDPARRANYDWFARNLPTEAIEPDGSVRYDLSLIPDGLLHCSLCGRITLQPRYITLSYANSDAYDRKVVDKTALLCVACARKGGRLGSVGWNSDDLIDPFIGIDTPRSNRQFFYFFYALFKVGLGEKHDRLTDQKLILHNVRALLEQGNIKTAYGLAKLIRTPLDEAIAGEVAEILRIIDASGVDYSGYALKDDWALTSNQKQIYSLLLFLVPAAVVLAVYAFNAHQPASRNQLVTVDGALVEGCPHPLERSGFLMPQTSAHGDLTLRISNTAWEDAVAKVRDQTSTVVASIFLKRGDSFDISGLPRGDYRIQFELGFTFDPSCMAFASPWHVLEKVDSSKRVISSRSSGQEIIEYELGSATRPLPRYEFEQGS